MVFNPASRKAILLLMLVLALGIALGAVGMTVINRRVYGARFAPQGDAQAGQAGGTPRPDQPRVVNRLTHDLDLTADQQKRLSEILGNMQSGYNAIRQQMNPQFDQVRAQGRDQIRQILTPEQLPKFEDFLRQLDEERRKRANR